MSRRKKCNKLSEKQIDEQVVTPEIISPKNKLSVSFLVTLFIITIIGFGLRTYDLGKRALHNDETLQLNGIQTENLAQLIQHCTHVDMHPPLSYLLEKSVYHFTNSIAALRFWSVIFGTLAIPLLFWAIYPIIGRRKALISAILSAFSYELIWYSRELRDYIFLYFFVVAAFGFFVRILQDNRSWPDWRNIAGFTIMNILATYSHYNTYLTWPVYAVLFFLWEFHGKKLKIRWHYVLMLAISAVVILISVAPTFSWFAAMRNVQGADSYRPGIASIYKMLAPFGYGNGWRFVVWIFLSGAGILAGIKKRDKPFAVFLIWFLFPFLVYIYVLGVPYKFVYRFYRYMIFIQLSVLVIMSYGIELISVLVGERKPRLVNITCGVIIFLTVIMMLPVFNAYYSLTATGRLYNEIDDALSKLSPRVLFVDNYYEMQHLRHYLPERMPVAFPPIFNNNNEYQRMNIYNFTKQALESDPLLVFFDAGNLRRRARTGRDMTWLDHIFKHRLEFINEKGIYLYKLYLNFAPINDMDKRIDRIYYNNIGDLPNIFLENKKENIAFGPEWYGLTIMGFDGKWQFLRVAGATGTLFFDRNKKYAELKMSGCAAGQVMTAFCDKEQIVRYDFSSRPLTGIDLRSRKQFRQYIPLANLLKQYNGVLNLPIAVNIPFDSVKFDLETNAKDVKIKKVMIKSNSSNGTIISMME